MATETINGVEYTVYTPQIDKTTGKIIAPKVECDLSKFVDFDKDAFNAYIKAKQHVFENFNLGGSTSSGDDEKRDAYSEWVDVFKYIENTIFQTFNLNRKGYLGQFFLKTIAYKSFLKDDADKILNKDFSKKIVNMNGFLSSIKSGGANYILNLGRDLGKWQETLNLTKIVASETLIANALSNVWVTQMMNKAITDTYEKNKDFIEGTLNFPKIGNITDSESTQSLMDKAYDEAMKEMGFTN